MFIQLNARKVIAIGAMGLLLGSAVIPATVSAAELVTPAAPISKVTNPGNIVNDDDTYYNKFEWYGNLNAFESGHYTKSLVISSEYTFEVKNNTDHTISFAPALDCHLEKDLIWDTSTSDWGKSISEQGKKTVDAHTTEYVTVPCLQTYAPFLFDDFGKLQGMYAYIFGLKKSDSTNDISYRIYQGPTKLALPYNVEHLNGSTKQSLAVTKDPRSGYFGRVETANVKLTFDNTTGNLNFLAGGNNESQEPAITQNWLNTLNNATTNASSFSSVPMLSFLNNNNEYSNSNAVKPMRLGDGGYHTYFKIHLNDLTVPANSQYLWYTLRAKDHCVSHDVTIKIPLDWDK